MSAEVLQKKPEQAPVGAELRRELGASACGGCPLLKLGCPGRAEAAPSCPPEAQQIKKEQIKQALDDDSVGAVVADSGGYYVLPNKVKDLQPVNVAPPAAKITRFNQPPAPPAKPKTLERRPAPRHGSIESIAGALAAWLVVVIKS